MISRKYLDDYRVEQVTDTKGRVRSEAVYVGGDYYLLPQVIKGDRRLIFCLSVLIWPALIGAMVPITRAAGIMYVMLPFIFSMFPMFFVTGAAFSLLREEEVMRRESAEKIARRLPPCSFAVMALSGAAFLGVVITAVISWNGFVAWDILFTALCAAICAASAFMFIKCRKIKAVRKSNSG